MADSRISTHTGGTVALNVTFLHNGVPENPFAIRRIDIYQGSEKPENLVAQVPVVNSDDDFYPSPVIQDVDESGNPRPGMFTLFFDVPADFIAPSAYVDVWRFIGTDPGGTDVDFDDETLWHSQCNRFFVFADNFYLDDGLVVPRLAFEPLDKVFRKPEIRDLEVGIMPLPLYDYDFNRITPIIPQLKAFISISTENCELLVSEDPCRIGIRQGSYRSNPFSIQYRLDTTQFLVGTYLYRIKVQLPDGTTRLSDDLRFTIY